MLMEMLMATSLQEEEDPWPQASREHHPSLRH